MAFKDNKYNKILREYENLRLQHKYDLDGRIAEIQKKLPTYAKLEDKLITMATDRGRKALMGDTSALDDIAIQADYIRASMQDLLATHGYPKDFLSTKYRCTLCNDTGLLDTDKCTCFRQAIADEIYTGYGLKEVLADENFNNFSFDYYSDDIKDSEGSGINVSPKENIKRIADKAKAFIENFHTSKDNLLLMGNTGVGKTFLANCIAHELLEQGHIVVYLTAFRLFDILENYKFHRGYNDSNDNTKQFDYILDCDLLIIDDLGTEMNNTFTTSQLYLIINERLLRQKSTIISTNLSLSNLNTNYSERIYSRIISSYSILKIIGRDIRVMKL